MSRERRLPRVALTARQCAGMMPQGVIFTQLWQVVLGEGESMRLAGAGLIAAVLALAGCKGTDSQPGDRMPGGIASRLKGKGKDKDKDANSTKDAPAKTPNWLDDVAKMPGATT